MQRSARRRIAGIASGALALAAQAVAGAPLLSVTPNPMKFGDVVVGTASAPQTLVVANAGDAPLTLGDFIGPSVGFSSVDGPLACTVGLVLAPAASCTAFVTFEPPFAGPDVEELTITSDGGNVNWFATGNGVLATLAPVPALSGGMLALLAACLGGLVAGGFRRQQCRDDRI